MPRSQRGTRAEGVGRVTTRAVVNSIIAIIVIDAILNYLLLFRL